MARYTYVLLLLAFVFPRDCVLSITMDIIAFHDDKRLVAFIPVENSTTQECILHSDGGRSLPINDAHVTLVTSAELDKYLTICTNVRLWPAGNFRVRKGLTFPGTKWCGAGNDAKSYSDLGSSRRVDSCCRQHDHCNISIPAFHKKYGLFNLSLFTCSHCTCDREFGKCLKRIDGSLSGKVIHALYFILLRMKCIEKKRVKVCVKRRFFFCTKHEYETKMVFSSP